MYRLDARKFFVLAEHMHAYTGAFQWRLRKEQEDGPNHSPAPRSTPRSTPSPTGSSKSPQKNHFRDARQNPELSPYIEGLR